MAKQMRSNQSSVLNPDLKSDQMEAFESQLLKRVIGQEKPVQELSELLQICLSGLSIPDRPVGSLLFLGPTGSGKTRLVEAAAETLYGRSRSFLKIDCAEFQNSHEIAKLIGSPPGYVGHRETQPILTQDAIGTYQRDGVPVSIVLFDEIEKASDALWRLLLGILDKATLTTGDNRRVDFSRCIIIMTSNLGGREITKKVTRTGLGFAQGQRNCSPQEMEDSIYETALEAARHTFSPEFMNRIDRVLVFRPLRPEHLERILDIELNMVQQRLTNSPAHRFVFHCTDAARQFLLKEGTDTQYGARPLKRTIERQLVFPFATLTASNQVSLGDLVNVDYCTTTNRLVFMKAPGAVVKERVHSELPREIFAQPAFSAA